MKDELHISLQKFGNRFKVLRKMKNLSQLDIEVETGIDRTEISRIERGLRNIEFNTILKLSKALKVELKTLFDFDN